MILQYTGCSQSAPDVVQTNCTVVFSYENEQTFPFARLSVFLQSNSDVRRCEKIKVYSLDEKYFWETNKIKKIATGNFQWAGNNDFIVPAGEHIPEGKYEITYINADEEQQVSYGNVKYDKKIYNLKAEEIADYMATIGTLNYGVFDSNDILLFFGEPTEEFSTSADIISRYENASYYKDVWVSYDNSVICILPKKQL